MERQKEYSEITQNAVITNMNDNDIEFEVMESYTLLINGFSIKTTHENAKEIA
jgi:hypothetical protein